MKKLILFWTALALTLSMAGCAGKTETSDVLMTLDEVSTLVCEKGYTQSHFQEALLESPREAILDAWGEPDGTLFGFWGEVWELEAGKYITLYYDADGCVKNVLIGDQ